MHVHMHVDYEFPDPIPMCNNTSNIKFFQPGLKIHRLTITHMCIITIDSQVQNQCVTIHVISKNPSPD
jgi:hypothetical protein